MSVEITLYEIVRQELVAANGEREIAAASAYYRVMNHETLRSALIRNAVAEAIDRHQRAIRKDQRRTILGKTHPSNPTLEVFAERAAPRADTLDGYAIVARDSLLNYPLRGGKRLGDATKTEIEAEASWVFKNARTFLTNGKWFKAIAAQLPDATTPVQKALTEAQLRTLRDQAEGKTVAIEAEVLPALLGDTEAVPC